MIPFNRPYISGTEIEYLSKAIQQGFLSVNGIFSQMCTQWFANKFHCDTRQIYMTTSCTGALEMAAMLCNIEFEDEVIVPSFTFVSSALAFTKFGATVKFVDSLPHHPNMDADKIELLITPKTKAIVAVHYNGVLCNMNEINKLAKKHNLYVIEDAAHGINAADCGKMGDLACYSFHETKNIHCGEGGMLVVNNVSMIDRADQLWLKGTNRLAFDRGCQSKYEWTETGGAYAMGELNAAFLWSQLNQFDTIISQREQKWKYYYKKLESINRTLPTLQGSSHIFYLICNNEENRCKLIMHLAQHGIKSSFHYQALHKSLYIRKNEQQHRLTNADKYANSLFRLPLYYTLMDTEIDFITDILKQCDIYME